MKTSNQNSGDIQLKAITKIDRWWKPKASNLLIVLYVVMLITSLPFSKAILLFFPSVITIAGIGTFGHFINDLYDIDEDKKAGKRNQMASLRPWKKRALIFISVFFALVPWTILPFDIFSVILLCAEFALLVAYAIPPVRLKKRKTWPIIADALYAYALPAVLAANTFFLASNQKAGPFFLVILCLWQLFYGVRHYLNHLADDRVNDMLTYTETLATQHGNLFVHRLIKNYVLPLEFIFFVTFIVNIYSYNFVFPFVVLGVYLLVNFFSLIVAIGRQYSFFSYRFSSPAIDSFYQNCLPVIPLGFLVAADWRYSLLALIHIVLFYRFAFKALLGLAHVMATGLVLLFAYPVVLLNKKIFSGNKKNQSANSTTGPGEIRVGNNQPNIAIVNINKAKYTETFINAVIPKLKYNVYYLYGGELPLFDNAGRHFLSNFKNIHTWAKFIEAILKLEPDYFLKQSICGYLQAKKIKLMLAQFGPTGAHMFLQAKNIGVPLIVYFHGYDIYNKGILSQYAEIYPGLFREAKKIICVSEYMVQRLEALGAPKEKLIHLPAYVNLDLFPYRDHSLLPPQFLAVGRFAETKSPHITILAFNKIIEQIPEATLTMVGKGGGGELFEACLILVKALGIEDKVTFTEILSHEDVAKEMQDARVFVQHSVTTPENGDMEGKPVAIMEAMCSGLPVISTRHPGIVELIEHQVTGILVNEYDVEAMADAMLFLATNNSAVRDLGLNASGAIQNHPLIRNHLQILEGIIDSCIAEA